MCRGFGKFNNALHRLPYEFNPQHHLRAAREDPESLARRRALFRRALLLGGSRPNFPGRAIFYWALLFGQIGSIPPGASILTGRIFGRFSRRSPFWVFRRALLLGVFAAQFPKAFFAMAFSPGRYLFAERMMISPTGGFVATSGRGFFRTYTIRGMGGNKYAPMRSDQVTLSIAISYFFNSRHFLKIDGFPTWVDFRPYFLTNPPHPGMAINANKIQ